jgi:hypothetical protein
MFSKYTKTDSITEPALVSQINNPTTYYSPKKNPITDIPITPIVPSNQYAQFKNPENHNTSNGWYDDLSLAMALQNMEFEIDSEMRRVEDFNHDFNNKEYRASSCRRQLKTFSTFVVLVQIIIVVIMIITDGIAPSRENPMIGPPATTLVIWGAKDGSLIKYRHQWWILNY